MKTEKKYILRLFILFSLASILLPTESFAQNDSSVNYKYSVFPVEIISRRNVLFDPALKERTKLDTKTGNLATALSYENVLFLKTYGPGILSTLSSRGTDASHTPIIWNGFSLQNSVNATPDPSIELLPSNYRAAYFAGGQSGNFGSGAIGGTIQLQPGFLTNQGLQLSGGLDFGSFGRNSETIELGYRSEKTALAAGLRMHSVLNNFPFYNRTLPGKPKQKLENAVTRGFSLNTDFRHELKKGGVISASIWYQVNRRMIPGTMISAANNAKQIDKNLRAMFGWERYIKKRHHLSIKSAFLYDYLFYDDLSLDNPSLMVQYASLNRIEYDVTLGKNHHILASLNHNYYKVFMSEYQGFSPERNQSTLFVAYKYNLPKKLGEVAIQAVEELTDGKLSPFCPAFSALILPKPYLPVKIRVNRNYRQPSFNDLYWIPGGNPDLKAEVSFSQEAGIGFEKKYNKNQHQYSISVFSTGFHQVINNRIVWVPGLVFWSPENIDRARSYGNETDLNFTWEHKKWQIDFKSKYTYTESVRARPRFEGDPTFGKQLPNIPMHLGSASFSLRYGRTQIYYMHRFTGMRFTTADNSSSIQGFQTGAVGINQSVKFLGITAKFWFECENIGNVSYEVIEYRPMPGRNFRGGISIGFHKEIPKQLFNRSKNK